MLPTARLEGGIVAAAALALGVAGCQRSPAPSTADAGAVVKQVSVPCEEVHEPAPAPTTTAAVPRAPADAGPPAQLYTRQVRTVMVDGVEETWVLRWRGKPELSCVKKEEVSTCACFDFAYAERGNLELARLRPDVPEEIFNFRDHLEEDPELQHWMMADNGPFDRDLSLAEIKKRPVFDAMELADYDHDGRATEFMFRVGMGGACGHTSTMRVVGISKKQPKLHFFPLSLRKSGWEQIRAMTVPGTVTVVDIPCGDHGSEEETATLVKVDAPESFKTEEKTRKCE